MSIKIELTRSYCTCGVPIACILNDQLIASKIQYKECVPFEPKRLCCRLSKVSPIISIPNSTDCDVAIDVSEYRTLAVTEIRLNKVCHDHFPRHTQHTESTCSLKFLDPDDPELRRRIPVPIHTSLHEARTREILLRVVLDHE